MRIYKPINIIKVNVFLTPWWPLLILPMYKQCDLIKLRFSIEERKKSHVKKHYWFLTKCLLYCWLFNGKSCYNIYTYFIFKCELICLYRNGFKYCYLTLIILFNINHLLVHCEGVSSITNTNSFIFTPLNSFKYSYLTLIILINTIIAHS